MKILNARLHNFRNHNDSIFDFGAHTNMFLGENGQGKTNILEALSYCCLTKSFYANTDETVMQRGQSFFDVTAELDSDSRRKYNIRVAYDNEIKKKKFIVNSVETEKFSSIIGMFPVVILSPENSAVTFGSPSERRKFIDIVISQSNSAYMEDVLEFRRVLRQRNKILSDAKGKNCENQLLPWNEMLLRYGIRITQKRRIFVEEFAPYITDAFLKIVGEKESPGITYAPMIHLNPELSEEDNVNSVRKILEKRYRDELRFGTTLVGPHRDELIFTLNDLQLKHFASQGQHKTFLVALKIAEFFYLKERCNETPIFLLDDIFSELDEHRSQKLLSLIEKLGQTFITATSEKIFGGANWSSENRKFHISNGQVINKALAA